MHFFDFVCLLSIDYFLKEFYNLYDQYFIVIYLMIDIFPEIY